MVGFLLPNHSLFEEALVNWNPGTILPSVCPTAGKGTLTDMVYGGFRNSQLAIDKRYRNKKEQAGDTRTQTAVILREAL